MNRGEIHWRENDSSGPPTALPAHRAPAVALPQAPVTSSAPITPWQGAPRIESRGEIHWREDH
jgi:hypothetical protein